MIKKLIRRAMRNYEDTNLVVRMKAKLFMLCCLMVLIVLPVIIAYSAYNEVRNPAYDYSINRIVIAAEAVTMALSLLVFILLVKGRFSLSAHLLIALLFVATWTVMMMDTTGSPLIRLDSVVFILGILTLTPLAVIRRKGAILAYGAANIAAFIAFAAYAKNQLNLGTLDFIDYLADTTIVMSFITLTSFSVFVINRRALDQMERDLADRERAERALVESQRRLADIINFLPDATFAVDLDRRVTIWNGAMEELTGIPAPGIIGTRAYSVPFYGHERPALLDYVLDHSDETRKLYPEIREEGDTATCEIFVPELGTDGAYLWSTAKPLYGPAGEITGAIESIRDITERRKEESEKARLEEHLLHAQKMESVGRLAGGVAHDFNNLLTTIMGNTSLVMMDLGPGNPAAAQLKDVMKAAESASTLTKQLLAFSRKQVISPRPIDLNAQITRTAQLLERVIGEDIRPVMLLDPGLGPIMADPGQVEQILINLAVNARDAMPGGGTITIETRPARIDIPPRDANPIMKPGDYAALTITDTGTGMTDDVIRHIFDPFFTTKPVGKGTGLGLASVYGAVRQNGGAIQVKSAPGRGTAMTVYFPAADAHPWTGEPAPDDGALPRGTEAVLVVEDDAKVRDFIVKVLSDLGYRVQAAHNGTSALETAGGPGAGFAILLIDVILPDMTGPVLAAQIVKGAGGPRVLFMSGHAESVIVHHGIVDGGINFIPKPFTARDLARRVRGVLDMKN
ncbi:MAG: response regulator [Spirochaetes bacterium]|nr:response regulator [Spirochaetota bacterium]